VTKSATAFRSYQPLADLRIDVEHMKFAARLLATSNGGEVTADWDALVIEGADEVVLLLTAATDFNFDKPQRGSTRQTVVERDDRSDARVSRQSGCSENR
jgi:alpha-L-fucosidase 2